MEWLRTPLVSEGDAGVGESGVRVASTVPPRRARLMALDLVRGVIMAVMAWDHSKDMISDRTLPVDTGSETWSGPLATYDDNFGLFLSRWLPHFCAPGFFFLMGIGMSFFHTSRLKLFDRPAPHRWSHKRIIKHFTIRGMILILMDRIVNIPFYVTEAKPSHWIGGFGLPGSPGLRGLLSVFEVLTALGLSMILCGMLLPLFAYLSNRIRYIRDDVVYVTGGQILAILLGCIAFVISNVVVVYYQDGEPDAFLPWPRAGAMADSFSDYLVRFTVLPGVFPQGDISYPVLPWIGINLWGIAAGYFFVSPLGRRLIGTFSLVQGVACWTLFSIIRTVGGTFGNYRGWPRGEPTRTSNFIISYLDVCKYPPSLAYALLTLGGIGFLTLALDRLSAHLHRITQKGEAAFAQEQWDAGLIRRTGNGAAAASTATATSTVAMTTGSTNYPTAASIQTITVNVIRPTMGDEKELQKLAGNGVSTSSTNSWCTRLSWCHAEFPYWPWYGRWLLYPLLTFGRVPLFYYVVHWYILSLGSLFFHGVGDGVYLAYLPIWWLNLLLVMFLLCAPYASWKERQGSESLWRFL